MKQKLCVYVIMLFLSLTGILSCEKMVLDEEKSDTASDSTEVSDANLVIHVNSLTRGNASFPCSTLMVMLYKDGKKVKDVVQKVDNEGFGTIAMNIKPASYQLLILAHSSEGNPSRPRPTEIEFSNKIGYSDTFYLLDSITIGNAPKTYSATLERATSMVRFKTRDVVPASVKSIRLLYTGGSATLDATKGYGYRNSTQYVYFDVTEEMTGKPLQVDLYTFKREDSDELKLTVTAYTSKMDDATVKISVEKDIIVPIKYSEISELSGYFFSDDPNGDSKQQADSVNVDFDIRINDSWTVTNYYTF